MQLALSTGSHPVRVLADVAPSIGLPSRRLAISISTAEQLAKRMGFEKSLPGLRTLLKAILPTRKEAVEQLTCGAVWIAVGYSTNGPDRLSVYANGAWGADPNDRWLRPIRLLARLGGEVPVAWLRGQLPSLVNRIEPAGCALDFGPQGLLAVKLYFRTASAGCDEIGVELAQAFGLDVAQGVERLAGSFFENHSLPKGSFFTLMFRPRNTVPVGIKIDICAHCTGLSEGQIAERWSRLAANLDIEDNAYRAAIKHFAIGSKQSSFRHANLGVGFADHRVRLNTYLQPITQRTRGSACHGTTERALWSGVDFLLRHQSRDGHWSDFKVPVGVSTAWITAVAGRALVATRSLGHNRGVETAIEAAASWLSANEHAGGGWGYNSDVPIDADTTAHSAIFLQAAAGTSDHRLINVLQRFRRDDGGFGTFVPGAADGGWVRSQPDVTAVVALALARLSGENSVLLRPALSYCRQWLQASRVVPSYWWKSPFYATAMMALLFSETESADSGFPCAGTITPETALDQALVLILSACTKADQSSVLTALTGRQECDGSWPASTQLCVTDSDCLQPWAVTNGYARCFTDHNRIFTTSITVYALALALSDTKRVN